MKLTQTMTVEASVHDVWAAFAHRFDEADAWMASVPRSYAQEGEPRFEGATTPGRICELRPDGTGMKASERFVAYDEAAKTCSVRVDLVDAPRAFPVRHNTLDFAVVEGPGGGATLAWTFGSVIQPSAWLLWPLLRLGMFTAWRQLSEEFVHYVETGTPHPRKVAALEKARAVSAA